MARTVGSRRLLPSEEALSAYGRDFLHLLNVYIDGLIQKARGFAPPGPIPKALPKPD